MDTACRRSGHGRRMGDHSGPRAVDLTLHPTDRWLQSGRDQFEKAMMLCVGGKAAWVGLCEGNNAAYRCLRSVLWEDGPPGHSGRLLPSTPTRLADGLGPKRLPYALYGDTPPKNSGPPFLRGAELSDSAGSVEYSGELVKRLIPLRFTGTRK